MKNEDDNRGARPQGVMERIAQFFKKSPAPTKRIALERGGWMRVNKREVKIVEELKKVPGLNYKRKTEEAGYSTVEVVYVTDEIGKLIELYIQYPDDYAGMELNEFIMKALPGVIGD